MRIVAFSLLAAIASGCTLPGPPNASQQQIDSITRGYVFLGHWDLGRWLLGAELIDGQMYLLGESGALISVDTRTHAETISGHRNVVLIEPDEDGVWTIRSSKDGRHIVSMPDARSRDFPPLPATLGKPRALLISDAKPIVLFDDTVARWRGADWTTQKLSDPLTPYAQFESEISHDGSTILVGTDLGEFGGGLLKIDVDSATVTGLTTRDGPVTDIIRDPKGSHCFVVAIAYLHVFTRGSVQKVCGDTSETIFSRKSDVDSDFCDDCTYPMLGLIQAEDGVLWAKSVGKYFRVMPGADTPFDFPSPQFLGDFAIDRSVEGLVFVWVWGLNWNVPHDITRDPLMLADK